VCVMSNGILKLQTFLYLGACYCTFSMRKSELGMHMFNYVRTNKGV